MKMNYMRIGFFTIILFSLFSFSNIQTSNSNIEPSDSTIEPEESTEKISLAYVESRCNNIPEPTLFSHLIYAFGEFNATNDGVIIPTPEKLRTMSELKLQNSKLKIILGIGGRKKEGFSEMARDNVKLKKFVNNCSEIISKYNLDGIDLDWEFPTTELGGHTACPQDAENYVKLVMELRNILGSEKWISFYSNNSGKWIDFKGMLPYITYVNVSGYNLSIPATDKPLRHQSPLYQSKECGGWCVSKSISHHIRLGIPRQKILLGIPFFGRGIKPFPSYLGCDKFNKYITDSCILCWSDEAKAPYYIDQNKNFILGFDNEESIESKCKFIRKEHLAGAFVWNYDSDFNGHRLAKTLKRCLLNPTSEPESL